MADLKDDQLEINLDVEQVEQTVKEPEIEIVKAEEAPKRREVAPEEGIRELKFQLEQEKLARAEAEKRARQAAEREYAAKNETTDTQISFLGNAINSLQQETTYLKAGYREAMATGDYDRAAEIQQRMSDNSARLQTMENGKDSLERQAKQTAPQYQQSMDPVEARASTLSPRSANWVRNNPQFATDQRLFQKMIAAHNLAMADGIAPDSDEYFATVEETLRIRRPEPVYEDPTEQAATVTQKRYTAPPAAPVSRSGTGTGTRANVVRLTEAEQEIAASMKMTNQEYAKNKLALQKEGKLN
jgi:hypothetical protein